MLIGDNHLSARNVGEDKHYIDNLGVSRGQYGVVLTLFGPVINSAL